LFPASPWLEHPIVPRRDPHRFVSHPQVAAGDRGWARRDTIQYLIGWDITNYFYYQWHKDSPFDIRLEHQGAWVPNANKLVPIIICNQHRPEYVPSFSLMASTNWLYNRINTQMLVIFNVFGNSGMCSPSITYMPGWWNGAFSFALSYTGFFGESYEKGMGIFKSRDKGGSHGLHVYGLYGTVRIDVLRQPCERQTWWVRDATRATATRPSRPPAAGTASRRISSMSTSR
jgi:hypothetical protein